MGYFADGFARALDLLIDLHPATISAIEATLVSTAWSVGIAMLLGLPAGFCLGYCDFPGRKLLRLLSDTLLAFPTVLIGLIVYVLITYRGPLGQFGLLFTLPGMVIGQSMLALPIVISWTAQAVEGMDPRCRLTLLTLGANSLQLCLLTIWEARYALCMVCATAFGRIVTEVGVAMMLGGNILNATRTMTTAIALETSKGEFAQGIALGLVLLAIAFALNAILALLRRRSRQ
ncbi:MAG: ABC transporter permease [Desulfovibrio sp.]|nr:ABC transporter permease [Desulfovibrio sp.]